MVLLSCKNNTTTNNVNSIKNINIDSIPLIEICKLSEDTDLLSNISSFNFIGRKSFCIATRKPARVYIYDENGLQKKVIGHTGRGPFEFIKPAIVKTYNNKIYVWCDGQLKLLVFDIHGNPIAEYTNIHHAIHDFVISDSLVFFYSPSLTDKGIVEIYNLKNRRLEQKYFGKVTNEHKIISFREGSGGILKYNNMILFTPADKLELCTINISSLSYKSFFIQDKSFPIEKINKSPADIVKDPNNTIYILGGNTVFGLFKYKNKIIIQTEIGKIKMKGLKVTDYSKRRQKYYFLNNEEMKVEYAITGKISSAYNPHLFASNGDDIFEINWDAKKECYYLYKIDFKKVIKDK